MELDRSFKNVHLIGIGGIGMSALGIMAFNAGMKVSGSDAFSNENTDMLREKYEIEVNIPQKSEVINTDLDLVVISSAIKEDNEELQEARRKNLKIIERANFLNFLTTNRKQIAVAGTHGKTTTSALLGETLWYGGCDPLVFTGGIDKLFHSNIHDGKGDLFVFEADESDASFHHFNPYAAIITNIEEDHVDFYSSMKDIEESFDFFISKIKRLLILNYDDSNCRKFIETVKNLSIKTYSISDDTADYWVSDVTMDRDGLYFDIGSKKHGMITDFHLSHRGYHNLSNTLSVIALILELELLKIDNLRASLKRFKGVKRRFDVIGKFNNCLVVDDYAHHPSEIGSVMSSCNDHFGEEYCRENLVIIFQPHRYSRLEKFHKEFADVMEKYSYKRMILAPVYSAGESPIDGVSSKLIYDSVNTNLNFFLSKDLDGVFNNNSENTEDGVIMLFLGAGDINSVGYRLVDNNEKTDMMNKTEQDNDNL